MAGNKNSGRKPKPTSVLELGTSAKETGTSVQPEMKLPDPPGWLSDESKDEYLLIGRELEKVGLGSALDGIALALLSDAIVQYVSAKQIVADNAPDGITVTDMKNVIQHPAVGIMNKAWERVLKACYQFGMTPKSRVGMSVTKDADNGDPLLEILMRRQNGNN